MRTGREIEGFIVIQLVRLPSEIPTHRALAVALVGAHLPAELVVRKQLLRPKVPDDVRGRLQGAPDHAPDGHTTTRLDVPVRLANELRARHHHVQVRPRTHLGLRAHLALVHARVPRLHVLDLQRPHARGVRVEGLVPVVCDERQPVHRQDVVVAHPDPGHGLVGQLTGLRRVESDRNKD